MKKTIFYVVGISAALLIAGTTLFGKRDLVIDVKTTQVRTGTINKTITATGTVEPLTKVEIGTQVSGVIKKLYVDYNAPVKANQLIAELDKTNLKAALMESMAMLRTAQNELDYQQKNHDRIRKLWENKVVSETDYEEALYTLTNAKATVEQRQSDVNKARTNLGYANIYSPINGVVISRAVDVGQTVAASYSTPTLFTIAQDLKQMQVEADVDEADIGQVEVGQHVSFTVDAHPDDVFTGTVTQIRLEPVEQSNVITYTVIVKADNLEGKLMPGLTASIEIFTLKLQDVKVLETKALSFNPRPEVLQAYWKSLKVSQQKISSAVLRDQNGVRVVPRNENSAPPVLDADQDDAKKLVKTAWVKRGDRLEPVEVSIGASDGILVEIRDGLDEGDSIVYSMEQLSTNESQPPRAQESPFIPKPPGRKTK